MNTPIPRLHMGCGESLRSHWLVEAAHAERLAGHKPPEVSRKPTSGKRKRERTRG
ncbi:MAG: hypothetical protein HZB57_08060 [Gammaproteobacteria bacterium]|nr:hypothetical protein [Gammaproteobacteria bacterium]